MRIDGNVDANRYVRDIQRNKEEMAKSAEKLSSGLRINRASDDPAGLVISERMRSQIASLEQEAENIEQQHNKLSVAESDLGNVEESLTRMRDLALSAANSGGNSEEAVAAYQEAMTQEQTSQREMVRASQYGKQSLLDGSAGSVADVKQMPPVDISTPEKATQAISEIDRRIDEIAEQRGKIGSTQKDDLAARQNSLSVQITNLASAESSIRDVDLASESARYLSKELALKSTIALAAQKKPDTYQAIQLLR
jgi:flagellin